MNITLAGLAMLGGALAVAGTRKRHVRFNLALDTYVAAAYDVLSNWPDDETPGIAHYPPGLPSFDEHFHDLLAWRDAERSALA